MKAVGAFIICVNCLCVFVTVVFLCRSISKDERDKTFYSMKPKCVNVFRKQSSSLVDSVTSKREMLTSFTAALMGNMKTKIN